MEFLHTMKEVSSLVSETLSKSLVNECCSTADISFEYFVNKSKNLEEHLPKFEEIYQMSTTPSLWSDLFSVECNVLCNRLLLNTNIYIAKVMASHVSKRSVDSAYSKRMELLTYIKNLSEHNMYNNENQENKMSNDSYHTYYDNEEEESVKDAKYPRFHGRSPRDYINVSELNESYPYNRSSNNSKIIKNMLNYENYTNSEENKDNRKSQIKISELKEGFSMSSLFSVISNLSVYNERLNTRCCEERQFYEDSCRRLFYLSEEDLLNRPDYVKRGRAKVLQFLIQLSRTLDIDKCTHNLSILFFDCYIHERTTNSSGSSGTGGTDTSNTSHPQEKGPPIPNDYNPFTDNEMLKIGTACYLLAGALREHWVDINKDKYLEQAIEMSSNAFTTKEVVAVQLDVLHAMPKGFTSIYTCMEYGLFFLANIKYVNFDMNISCDNSNNARFNYFDDFLFLASSFSFMVQTGSLCWVYNCLSRWDDLYVAKNWNRFIPPSRCAAVLIFHFFVTFFNVDFEKDLIWCRRFCHRVFKMFFDSDVALWYVVFRENIRSFLVCIEKSSERMQEMSSLFSLSANVFRTIEAIICLYHTKVLLGYFHDNKNYSFKIKELTSIPNSLNRGSKNIPKESSMTNMITRDVDMYSKNNSMDVDVPKDTASSAAHLFGLDYEKITLLFSNLIDVLKQT